MSTCMVCRQSLSMTWQHCTAFAASTRYHRNHSGYAGSKQSQSGVTARCDVLCTNSRSSSSRSSRGGSNSKAAGQTAAVPLGLVAANHAVKFHPPASICVLALDHNPPQSHHAHHTRGVSDAGVPDSVPWLWQWSLWCLPAAEPSL